jgi:hypothetical protein
MCTLFARADVLISISFWSKIASSSWWNPRTRIEILFLRNYSIKYAKYDAYSAF